MLVKMRQRAGIRIDPQTKKWMEAGVYVDMNTATSQWPSSKGDYINFRYRYIWLSGIWVHVKLVVWNKYTTFCRIMRCFCFDAVFYVDEDMEPRPLQPTVICIFQACSRPILPYMEVGKENVYVIRFTECFLESWDNISYSIRCSHGLEQSLWRVVVLAGGGRL